MIKEIQCPICNKRVYRWNGFCNIHEKIWKQKKKELRKNFIQFMVERETMIARNKLLEEQGELEKREG